MNLLEVSNVSKTYGSGEAAVKALKKVSFSVPKGEYEAIGRALITRPSLILADEPTGNLDTQNSSEVIALLKEASRKYEQTIIMITHNRNIAQSADRILQVSDGVLTDLGRCRE